MYLKIKLCLAGIFITGLCVAQSDTTATFKTGKYKVFVKIESGFRKKKQKGYPVALNDSGMWMTKGFVPKKDKAGKLRYDLVFVDAENIERLYFRRNGTIGIGIIAGAIAGSFAGAGIGSAVSNSTAKPYDALTVLSGLVTGFYSGAVIGGITAGHIRRRFDIGGNRQNFMMSKSSMTRYLPAK